jgi:hypothetical protein
MNGSLPAFFSPLSAYKHLYPPPRFISTQQARVSGLLHPILIFRRPLPRPLDRDPRPTAANGAQIPPIRNYAFNPVPTSQFNSKIAPCKGAPRFLRMR